MSGIVPGELGVSRGAMKALRVPGPDDQDQDQDAEFAWVSCLPREYAAKFATRMTRAEAVAWVMRLEDPENCGAIEAAAYDRYAWPGTGQCFSILEVV